jgi:membrane associated rhomboid family serine protease
MIPIKDNIPTDRFPIVTAALVLANFIVYILAIRHGGSFISGPDTHEVVKYGTIPYAVLHPGTHCGLNASGSVACQKTGVPRSDYIPSWQTIFTGMFLHASILHIGGNMIFLWIFGNNVEHAMGPVKYLAFYFVGGIAALALQVALGPHSTAPTLGASGAIAAVLGAYIVLYPRARVLTLVLMILFFTVIELPVWVMLGVWFAEQAVFAATGLTNPTGGGGGVAYFAHVGGFAFGLLAVRLLATRAPRPVPPPRPVF